MIRLARLTLVILALGAPGLVAAQGADDLKALRQEVESLKAGIGAVQRDLQDIKALLQKHDVEEIDANAQNILLLECNLGGQSRLHIDR